MQKTGKNLGENGEIGEKKCVKEFQINVEEQKAEILRERQQKWPYAAAKVCGPCS